ncbi:hypothetical protein [Herbaspirillum rubrisubalbicans]|uniref:hypothetical protein n=1 Tax=Herbaspirillum rubrisubalbicans TaxID=80842 RepID=UPI00077CDAB5
MASRAPYRRHSPQFKIQICADIRSGKIGRGEALKTHNLSANLMQMWLGQFDRGELDAEDATASTVEEYEAHIAALERKVGQLTMALDLLKKTPRLRLVSNSENSSIISGNHEPACAERGSTHAIDNYAFQLSALLRTEAAKSRKQWRTLKQIHEDLKELGFKGSYDRVAAFARTWREGQSGQQTDIRRAQESAADDV